MLYFKRDVHPARNVAAPSAGNIEINLKNYSMKDILKIKLNSLSDSDFSKVKQLYAMSGIRGNTIDEFVNNVPDKTVQGIINLCNKQLGL